MSRIFATSIVARHSIAENSVEVVFDRPPGFEYRSGQYIQLGLRSLLHRDAKGPSRVLSVSTSPHDTATVAVAFRESDSGFKRTLRQLAPGSEVLIEGPHGFYTLPRELTRPLVLVAGGIGVVPYVSMLRYLTESGIRIPVPMTLLYANGTIERAAYLDELRKTATRAPGFVLRHRIGLIDRNFLERNVYDPRGCAWHVSGPPAMVCHVRNLLFHLRVDEARICYEEFSGY